MSSMEELKQRIGIINSRIGQINDQRNKNIGMRESLTAQLNQNISDYQAKYGVDLSSAELVEAEYNRVAEEIGEGVSLLENVVSKIEAGDYSGANALLGVEPKEQVVQPVQPASQPVQLQSEQVVVPAQTEQVVQPVQPASQPTAPVAPQPVVPEVPQPVAPQPTAPVTPEPVAPPTAPSMSSMTPPPVPPAPSTESFLAGFEKPATPTGVTPPAPTAPVQNSAEAPSAPVNPMSFGGILGGTQFEA